jgi:hypothetical protein
MATFNFKRMQYASSIVEVKLTSVIREKAT